MRTSKDCTGRRFGMLKVLEKTTIQPRKNRQEYGWELLCDCGVKIVRVRGDFDKAVGIKSCGCSSTQLKKQHAGMKTEDLTGQKFGELTVSKTVRGWSERGDRVRSSNECLCSCGAVIWFNSAQLKKSKFLNCRDRSKHLIGAKYPTMPTPMPDRVAQLVKDYYHLVQGAGYEHCRADIQDENADRLERVCWIVSYRESLGESLSELYIKRLIFKWIQYSGKSVIAKAYQLKNLQYNLRRKRKKTGGEMTDLTSFNDAVQVPTETQQESVLPKKRSFKRR